MAGCLWISDRQSAGTSQYIFKYRQSGSDTFDGFTTGYETAYGVGIERSTGCLWVVGDTDSIVRYNQSGSAEASFGGPSNAKGVEPDADDSLWVADYPGGSLARYTSAGSQIDAFSVTHDPGGVGVSPDGSIWSSDYTYNRAYKYTSGGSYIESLVLPSGNARGVGIEATGSIWTSHAYPVNSVWETNSGGTAVTSFEAPQYFTYGMAIEYEAQGSQYSQTLSEVVKGSGPRRFGGP